MPKRSIGKAPTKDVTAAIVLANANITGPALTESFETQSGVRVKTHVSLHLKRKIVDEANQVLPSYLEKHTNNSPEDAADLQVRLQEYLGSDFVHDSVLDKCHATSRRISQGGGHQAYDPL